MSGYADAAVARRYFFASDRVKQYGGWDRISYISFPSVGAGWLHLTDGTIEDFEHDLAWALEAVADGSWVEIYPFGTASDWIERDIDALLSEFATEEEEEHDFLVTATVQVITPAPNRVAARALVSDVIRGLIEASPYASDPMQGFTVDSVVIEDEGIEDLTAGYEGVEESE